MTTAPSKIKCNRRSLAAAILAAGILFPAAAAPELGDDLFLLTTSVAPNVVLFLDNSDSMTHIEWHPEFDPTLVPTCADFDNDTVYDTTMLANSETHCGRTRQIFAPVNPTLWHGRYLNWYFSPEADPFITEIETATADAASCNQAGAGTRFVDKYRRTRADAAKQVLLDVLCLSEWRGIRFGFAEFRAAADVNGEDPNGGFISVEIDDPTPDHAADMEASIGNTRGDAATPLGETLLQLYTYLMPRDPALLPLGIDGVTQFPPYAYDLTGNLESNASKWLADPVEYDCQKNFVVVVTDGVPSRDDFDTDPPTTSVGFSLYQNLIGDYNADAEVEEPGDADETGWYLDDIAKYMHEKDLRPDYADDQTVDVYTVGFATDAATTAFLERTADVANGLSFHAKDGDQLAEALVATLNDIIEKSHSFTAATVPSARTTDGGDFYNSFFLPSSRTAFWEGHLRAWHMTADGDIEDKFGNCALDDPDAGECNSGNFLPGAAYFWDAGQEVPAPGSRNLLVSKRSAGTPGLVAFDDSLAAGDLEVAPFAAPPDHAPNSTQYAIKGSTAINENGLKDEIVAYVRGCAFGTGVTTADVSAGVACDTRPWLLGDIFHSDPIVVGQPKARIREDSYEAFKSAYAGRARIIYAGTNAGFLEGFHAGNWDGAATPPRYTEGSGEERFGFMPWESRKKIKNLPIDDPTARTHYVDGSPQAADVWLYPTSTTASKADNGSEWRSVVLGGLRQGGRQYYAIDVTNPDGVVGPGGTNLDYPGYFWEFPPEDDPDGDLAYMGQTWSQPIVTRVRVAKNGNTNNGLGFERWVAIVTGGYHATSDPNPADVIAPMARVYSSAATAGRAIFIIDIKTGEVLAEKKFNSGASDGTEEMLYAIPSTPAVFDLDFDGFADVIYVGDLGGRVWKWVIHPIGEDRVNDGLGLRTQPSWPFKLFFQAPSVKISGTDYYKNFYFAPAAAHLGSRLWLAFGSGERGSVAYAGQAGDENNRFYVVTDLDPLETLAAPLGTVQESDLLDLTGDEDGATITGRGFFFRAADGEKFATGTEIFAKQVIVSSFSPTTTGNPCTSRGDAKLYVFDLGSGAGSFQDGAGNPTRGLAIGTGLPTDPKLSVGVGGEGNRIFIEKSGADLTSIGTTDIDVGGRFLYWREVP